MNVSNPLPPSTTRMRCGVNCSLRTTSNVCTGRPATSPPGLLVDLIDYTSGDLPVAGYRASTLAPNLGCQSVVSSAPNRSDVVANLPVRQFPADILADHQASDLERSQRTEYLRGRQPGCDADLIGGGPAPRG